MAAQRSSNWRRKISRSIEGEDNDLGTCSREVRANFGEAPRSYAFASFSSLCAPIRPLPACPQVGDRAVAQLHRIGLAEFGQLDDLARHYFLEEGRLVLDAERAARLLERQTHGLRHGRFEYRLRQE